jgi:16S rRNA G527 N7-methylase RsmG
MEVQSHWETVHKTKTETQVSWFSSHLGKSLQIIKQSQMDKQDPLIDVGGGASTLQ